MFLSVLASILQDL